MGRPRLHGRMLGLNSGKKKKSENADAGRCSRVRKSGKSKSSIGLGVLG